MESSLGSRKEILALVATIIASGMTFLDGTIINLALPAIAEDLNAGLAAKQWVVVGFLISLSSMILIGGSLGDLYGRKKVYLIGVTGFGIASLACALSPNAFLLVTSRFIQGIFGALVVPGSLAIINSTFAQQHRARAIGIWTAFTSAMLIVGPFLGGFIVDTLSWRIVFLINAPLTVVTIILSLHNIDESQATHSSRQLDIVGACAAVVSLAFLSAGLIQAGDGFSAGPIILIVLGNVIFPFLIIWEKNNTTPIVDVTIFKVRNFAVTNIATFLFYGALSGYSFILAQQLIDHSGYSPTQAGAATVVAPILLMLLSSRIGGASQKIGPRLFMGIGPFVCAAGFFAALRIGDDASYIYDVFPSVIFFGLGLSMIVAPLTSTAMSSLDDKYSGMASGVNNAVSRVGGSLVIAIVGIFPSAELFRYTIIFCTILAIAAGFVSLFGIVNQQLSNLDG